MTKDGLGKGSIYYCRDEPSFVKDRVPKYREPHVIYGVDDGKINLSVITIFPYEFTIHDGAIKKTEVRLISQDQSSLLGETKTVLLINTPISLPWHDKEEVLRKLKLYILFS